MSTTHSHKAPPRPWPTEQLETHDDRSKREHAAFVLQSRDHLWWYAASMNSTLPQTRLHFTKILSGLDPSLPPAKYTSVRPGLGILPPSQRGQSAAQPAEPQRSKRRERASLGTAGTGDEKERGERKGKGKERERRSDGGSARRVSGRVRDADGDVEMTTTMPERATPRARAQDRSQAVGRSVLSTARVEARRGDLGRVEPEPGPEPDDEVEIEADGGVRIDY